MTALSPTEVEHSRSAIRGSATVAAWTLVSRVTGLARVIVIGAVLGPTFFANIFVATNTIPNIVYLAVAGSVLGSVVVPAVVHAKALDGTSGARDLLGRLAGFLLLVTGAAAVLLLVCSPLIAKLLTFGVADPTTRWRAEQMTVVMLVFVAPQIVFYMIAVLGAAAQQAQGRFALAAAAPAAENIGLMATVAAVGFVFEQDVGTDGAPLGLAITLCVGSTLSVMLHMVLQLVGAARVGLTIKPRFRRRRDPLSVEVTKRIRRSFVVAACPCASYFVLLALAGTVPGGVLVLQMAYAVYAVPVALGARAVSTAVLPGLSAAAHRTDPQLFNEKMRAGIAHAFVASLPPSILLVAFAFPIADILANGRLRVGDLIQTLAGCIIVLAVAQVAAGLREVGLQGLFAQFDIRGPRLAALLSLGSSLGVGFVTVLGVEGNTRLIGLGAAVLVGDVVAATTVMLLLRRSMRPSALVNFKQLSIAVLVSTVMLPVVAAGCVLMTMSERNRFGDAFIVGMTSILALGLFALTMHAVARRTRVAA